MTTPQQGYMLISDITGYTMYLSQSELEHAQQVLQALLEKYADTGIENIEDIKILTLDPLSRLGTPAELVKAFGGKDAYLKAVTEMESLLYSTPHV